MSAKTHVATLGKKNLENNNTYAITSESSRTGVSIVWKGYLISGAAIYNARQCGRQAKEKKNTLLAKVLQKCTLQHVSLKP